MVVSSVSSDLNVSGIFHHKSFIEVNEEETVAAVATAVVMGGCCMLIEDDNEINFVADHLFLFLIRDGTIGVVMFVGHFLNPLSA